MRRILLPAFLVGIAATSGCAAEHYAGMGGNNSPGEADDSNHEHCVEHPEDCPDPDDEEHGDDPGPGTQSTDSWPCELSDTLGEAYAAGITSLGSKTTSFTSSDGVTISSPNGFWVAMDCLDITELPGGMMVCSSGSDMAGNPATGKFTISTPGDFDGANSITSCDHELDVIVTRSGSGNVDFLPGSGGPENTCSGEYDFSWGTSSRAITFTATRDDAINGEGFALAGLVFEGDCK